MADWPIGGPHISTEHNRRDQKGLVMIKHPVTKNSAKEEPQNCINAKKMRGNNKEKLFSTLSRTFFYSSVLLSPIDVIVLFQCFTVTLIKV